MTSPLQIRLCRFNGIWVQARHDKRTLAHRLRQLEVARYHAIVYCSFLKFVYFMANTAKLFLTGSDQTKADEAPT